MSETRQFSKTLAVASNYDIPNLSETPVRSLASYTAPTLYNDFEFAHFSAIYNHGYSTYSLYGMTLFVQTPSDEDIVLKLYDGSSQVNTIEFTLSAGSSYAQLGDQSTTPAVSGLGVNNTYHIKCVQATTPGTLAQGGELTYFLNRI